MRKILVCMIMSMMVLSSVNAQQLIPIKNYGENWYPVRLSTNNKPNGYIYRLRVDKQCTDLPPVKETRGMELYISEPIDLGWLAFYRLPTSANDYAFVVVIYNHDKKPIHTIDLCDVAQNRYCEVQDVRWDADNHHLLFNMACPTYSSQFNGKCSKLYCYNVEQKRILWETDYLVSNDIFILSDKYVFCSYGFTSEKKFLFMLDKLTGTVYSKLPLDYKVRYMELQQKDGSETLYVVDYKNHLLSFSVGDDSALKQKNTGNQLSEPKVFTVVFATSNDGYLNVRQSPSTKGKILSKLHQKFHDLGGGVLRQKGSKWSKVSLNKVTGWVFTKYLGYQTWYKGNGSKKLIANRDNMPIYGEDFVGDGDYPLFTTVKRGTIIADDFDEIEGYYVLKTGHDNLFIKKKDARVE